MEPALDVLWYKLDNFVPLVLCMPRDLYQEVVLQEDMEDECYSGTLVSNVLYAFHSSTDFLTTNRSLFKGQC